MTRWIAGLFLFAFFPTIWNSGTRYDEPCTPSRRGSNTPSCLMLRRPAISTRRDIRPCERWGRERLYEVKEDLLETHNCNSTLMKQSRTVSNKSVTFPTFPQIVAWTDGYMVCDNKIRSLLPWICLECLRKLKSTKTVRRFGICNTYEAVIPKMHAIILYLTDLVFNTRTTRT